MVGEFQVHCALQIAEEVLYRLPVCGARIGVEASEDGDGISDIRASGDGKIHDSTNSTEIWNSAHEGDIFISCGAHRCIEAQTRIHGCGDRVAV